MVWALLFPPVNAAYTGSLIPFYFLILVSIIGTIRSLIHIFALDGGAHSIAGMDVNVDGGKNLIAIFAQWGAMQLLLVLLDWLVILRYQFLVPAMLAVVVLEQIFRIAVGRLKPFQVANPPPGAYGSYILLPIAIIAFLWSLL